jgi:hypothetical protein
MAEKYAKRYHVGLGHVGSYQVSARPFVTSSLGVPKTGAVGTVNGASADNRREVVFPYVTKFVTIRNDGPNEHGATMRVAFSEVGLQDNNRNYFILSGGESFSADFKITKLYLMGHDGNGLDSCTTASVIAGLTGIEADLLSGSWHGHEGV